MHRSSGWPGSAITLMFLLEYQELLVAVIALFAASMVLATIGFGFGITTSPVLLMVLDPQAVVVTISSVSIILFSLIITRKKRHLSVSDIYPWILGGVLGAPLGVFILNTGSASILRISITILIMLLTVATVFNYRIVMPKWRIVSIMIGFVVGVLSTSLGVGGPLIILILITRNWNSEKIRACMSAYYISVLSVGILGYILADLYTVEIITLIVIGVIPVIIGYSLATHLIQNMNERLFHVAVFMFLMASSSVVLGKEIMRIFL